MVELTEEKIIKEHTEWATNFFRFVYEQAFRHGLKHGKEIKEGHIQNAILTELGIK